MKVKVTGDIIDNESKWIYDWLEWESCCPADVERAIEAAAEGETLEVEISSPGGYIFAGSQIYSAIRGYRKGSVEIQITGLAASAASVIATAGYCLMSPTSLFMIHNVSGGARGDYREMETAAEMLRECNRSLIGAYTEKTGMSEAELQELMDRETWLSASRAVELGFVDGIIPAAAAAAPEAFVAGVRTIPKNVADRIRALFKPGEPTDSAKLEAVRREIEYMELKGAARI